jgi:antirestriction protein ArdC
MGQRSRSREAADSRPIIRLAQTLVVMPRREAFDSPEFYYSVLFHELTHSTGAVHRLNRATLNQALRFGDTNYSREELVAEMGAAFLSGHTGIEQITLTTSAAYLDNWIKALKGDARLAIQVGAAAQKAVDFILNRKPEDENGTPS